VGASRHRGGKAGGIIWTPHPRLPASPRRLERGAEWSLIFELGALAAECWSSRSKGDDADEPITMLWALTRWFCSIELPMTQTELINGGPILSRRRPSLVR
jgi:hypothetical protein